MNQKLSYDEFLKNKIKLSEYTGFDVTEKELEEINTGIKKFKPHQKDSIIWAAKGGRRALFASFGLGKTCEQLALMVLITKRFEGKTLIIMPLGVKQEFKRDAKDFFNIELEYVRTQSEVELSKCKFLITNYERVRDGDIDPNYFLAVSLDEASVLRGYGTKTYQRFLTLFSEVRFKFVATATPSPNKYKELIHYAGFLGVMDTGQSLAQPLYSKILTPNGWIYMRDIKPGDSVISVNGVATEVLSVHPQGYKDIYRVIFSDGSFADCTEEHLWETQTQYERNAYKKYVERNGLQGKRWKEYFTVKDTKTIMETLRGSSTDSKNHSIPLVAPVQFMEQPVLIDPYVLGLLLGDGHIRQTSIAFTTADSFLIEELQSRITPLIVKKNEHVRKDGQPNYDYSISTTGTQGGSGYGKNFILKGCQTYNLCGKRAWEKYIPDVYKYNSVDVRLEVLQGLMDTDGTIAKEVRARTPKFVTTSERLADDVIEIVQSLGGIATKKVRQGRTPSGSVGRIQYNVSIMLPDKFIPFKLPRKAELVVTRTKYKPARYIDSIEKIGNELCQCIAVKDDRHLYVTDNYIVTHNTRFFKRDSTQANNLTLYPHKEKEFWLWVSSWALFITSPADLGYDATGYDLPPLEVRYHEIKVDHSTAGVDRDGQVKMFREASLSLKDAAKEKRDSIQSRLNKMLDIIYESPDDHFILWHDLEAERHAIRGVLSHFYSDRTAVEVYGSQDLEVREQNTIDFADGKIKYFASKPEISGSGSNFQRYCHRAIFLGIGYKFNDLIQSIHRVYRFGQTEPVVIDIIYTESEREVLKVLLKKWEQHNYLVNKMVEIIREFNLSHSAMQTQLKRSFFNRRVEVKKDRFIAINADNVPVTSEMKSDSVDLIHTSIPFANHYEYTPTFNDFGHTTDNDEFFKQMDYLTPELLRVLKPGRVAAIHVKDRILFGNATGDGMPTVDPFSDLTVFHFLKHGFRYMGRIIVLTDVVRENNQTYRLGWTENCKDGTKMGVGCPEYILLFRKLPTDTTTAYADTPVVKDKADYSRARWQLDAHAFWRSSGDRLLTSEELRKTPVSELQATYRKESRKTIYDFKEHEGLSKYLNDNGKLPASFMVVAPGSWSNLIWDDINRMNTLNSRQSQKSLNLHICPLQFDIVDRVIERFSAKDEVVYDPFAGLMTVPYRAVKMGRKGIGCELNEVSFTDGLDYLHAAEEEYLIPSLFDIVDSE